MRRIYYYPYYGVAGSWVTNRSVSDGFWRGKKRTSESWSRGGYSSRRRSQNFVCPLSWSSNCYVSVLSIRIVGWTS